MSGTAITESAESAAAEQDNNNIRHAGDEGEAGSVAGDGEEDDDDGGSDGYQPLWVRLACIGLDFLTQTYDQIRIVPEIVLFEQYVCRSYHDGAGGGGGHGLPDGRIPHQLCKNPDVQYQLARLRSWKALFDGLAILITAIPMGILADRVGRKKVIASSVLGPILQLCWILLVCMGGFQERGMSMIWAGSAFLLMGNLSSANATIYAMAADSCPPAQRSRYFYYLYSTFLVCELFAPALASVTIERNLLIPFGVGLTSLLTCFPILHVMPETHRVGGSPVTATNSRRSSSSSDKNQREARETDQLLSSPTDATGEPVARSRRSLLSVVRNRNILLALFVLFIGALRQGTVSVLLQYAAVRFGWPTSRTAMLVSVIAASNIVLFLVILPQTVAFLTSRWHVMPQLIDYNVVSASLVILTVGATFMGLASSMHWLICATLFFATGYGTRVAVLSLVTSWTDEDTRASTFGIAQIVEGFGRMGGDPILLRIFARSMRMEGILQGLPFYVAAVGFGLAAVAWRFVRLRVIA
ncbi:major facilitator superfamily domain-containing protein [Diaporthe sp. PMI_573]|nr:major facilitator superfamily domain-containing protein [Diaporthaceae sp. PMI_573]